MVIGALKAFIKRLWNGIKNFDAWIETLRPGVSIFLSMIIVFYIILDIVGKVPQALHTNLAVISATLGGLILAGALFSSPDEQMRRRLMGVAKRFVLATFLFLIFFFCFSVTEAIGVVPFTLEISIKGMAGAALFWFSVVGIYGGSYVFASALDLPPENRTTLNARLL